MQQYNTSVQFEQIAINITGSLPKRQMGNQHLLIDMDYFSKWQGAYAIPNQEAFKEAGVLMTNFFWHVGVLREVPKAAGSVTEWTGKACVDNPFMGPGMHQKSLWQLMFSSSHPSNFPLGKMLLSLFIFCGPSGMDNGRKITLSQ
jgi:hypothetical protein